MDIIFFQRYCFFKLNAGTSQKYIRNVWETIHFTDREIFTGRLKIAQAKVLALI
ncbi:MAG: hypothetical protein ACI9XJ_001257 [Marivirga sp.]|jgi:hypothetical protein